MLQFKPMKKGFTLIELSIVLIIIGLLIGAIIAGNSMVKAARTQSVIADIQKYSAATNDYFNKYGYWPGDDYEANTRWSGVTNGNGDGALGAAPASMEYYYFWQDLSVSGLISGSYTGCAGCVPVTQLTNTAYITHYYDATYPSNQAFYISGTNAVGYAASPGTYIVDGKSALAIDRKIDDSVANTGNVISIGSCASGASYVTSAGMVCNVIITYKK